MEQRGWCDRADIEAFLAAGFTQTRVLEVLIGVAIKTFTNYTNHMAQPPINAQFQAYAPERTQAV